jgi:hypothetical protein
MVRVFNFHVKCQYLLMHTDRCVWAKRANDATKRYLLEAFLVQLVQLSLSPPSTTIFWASSATSQDKAQRGNIDEIYISYLHGITTRFHALGYVDNIYASEMGGR